MKLTQKLTDLGPTFDRLPIDEAAALALSEVRAGGRRAREATAERHLARLTRSTALQVVAVDHQRTSAVVGALRQSLHGLGRLDAGAAEPAVDAICRLYDTGAQQLARAVADLAAGARPAPRSGSHQGRVEAELRSLAGGGARGGKV